LALLSPLFFVTPGMAMARRVTGRTVSLTTLAWSVFFSVLFLPLASFAAAMVLGTVANPTLLVWVAAVLSAPALLPQRFLEWRR
jgi:hypothetical protein